MKTEAMAARDYGSVLSMGYIINELLRGFGYYELSEEFCFICPESDKAEAEQTRCLVWVSTATIQTTELIV